MDQYIAAREECRRSRWLFDTSVHALEGLSPQSLRSLEKEVQQALSALTSALEIRTLRCQRFAAAYDEFANDESVERLFSLKEHCLKLLQHLLVQLPSCKSRTWWDTLLEILRSLFCLGLAPSKRQGHTSMTVLTDSMEPMKDLDAARRYFGTYGSLIPYVQKVHNLAPAPVSFELLDPVRAANIARRKTFREKLANFLVCEEALVPQFGRSFLLDLQHALYRRAIAADPILLAKSKAKTLTLIEFLDDAVVNSDDLERLWMEMYQINPAVLRDALLDLENAPLERQCVSVLGVDIAQSQIDQELSPQGWSVLYRLLTDRLSFGDFFFLCSSAKEFSDMAILTALRHAEYQNLATNGKTGTDSLLLCMRALGYFVTFWETSKDREVITGIMVDVNMTRKFVRVISSAASCSVWARFGNGTVFSNDQTLESDGRRPARATKRKNQDPIKVNIESSGGEKIECLYHRNGERFVDGCEIRIAPRFETEGDRETWKLEVLQALTKVKMGHQDVCKALDTVLAEVDHRCKSQKTRMKIRFSQNTQGELVQRLKHQYSTASLASVSLGQPSLISNLSAVSVKKPSAKLSPRSHTRDKPLPSKLRPSSSTASSGFESCTDEEDTETPESSVHPMDGQSVINVTPLRQVASMTASKKSLQSSRVDIPMEDITTVEESSSNELPRQNTIEEDTEPESPKENTKAEEVKVDAPIVTSNERANETSEAVDEHNDQVSAET